MYNSLLSLGSNLDNRKLNIENCIKLLKDSRNINVVSVSSMYETSPMYNLNQESFINCVIEIETSLNPLQLIEQTQSIEKKIGKESVLERNQRGAYLEDEIP